MKLRSIRLSWFRGAAHEAVLELGDKSVVVFGSNGAGKSSFVDGVEALLSGGRVGHLSHEYSGRNQERGLINTARGVGKSTVVEVIFADGSSESLTWLNTSATRTQNGASTTSDWDYGKIALRQEELSHFIAATKGEKYNALLPLLGLNHLEAVAENLHKLVKAIERKSDIQSLRSKVDLAASRRAEVFPTQTDEQLWERLEQLRLLYAPAVPVESKSKTIQLIGEAIINQIGSLDADQRRAAAIGEIGASDLTVRLKKVSEIAAKIAEVAEPLIKERLDVLGAASAFGAAWNNGSSFVACPACGQVVELDQFRDHVASERDRLSAVESLYEVHKVAVAEVCDEVLRLRNVSKKPDLSVWRTDLPSDLQEAVNHLGSISLEILRARCTAEDITEIQLKLEPLVLRAVEDGKYLPPQVQTLTDHQSEVRALADTLKAITSNAAIVRAQALLDLTKQLQSGIVEEIADRARITFADISSDVQRYWSILQPSETIKDIKLLVPEGNDKAIEVALCFHGQSQASPRLTLSEGQRNALGLCIFLAMANKASSEDQPIILDDVVISFDREHRSRVAALLVQEFADRQIILLTHDREWSFELQRVLPQGKWSYRRLRPYVKPAVGITFADEALEFATARALAAGDPVQGLAYARRIMDVGLGEIAERIGLPVPHLRGDDNDHRTTGQFLVALERVGSKAFKKRDGTSYVPNAEALAAIKKAKPDLAIWANRGTHTFSGSETEAIDVLDGCEAVLSAFLCSGCETSLGVYEGTGGKVECRCGALQWRSG